MKNKIIPILLIIWSILFFIFNLTYSGFATDILVESAFSGKYGEYDEVKVALENIRIIIVFAFWISLIVMCIINIVKCKKNNVKVLSGGYGIAILGLVIHILGLIGISWLVILIAGIIMLVQNKK